MKHFEPKGGWSSDEDKSPNGTADKVANFSRYGSRLRVLEIHGADPETAKGSAPEEMAGLAMPGDAAAIGQSLDEMLAVLSAGDESGVAIREVSGTLRGLAALTAEKRRLDGELQTVIVQIASMQQLLERHVAAAGDSELRALEACKLRVDLVQELAASLLPKELLRGPR